MSHKRAVLIGVAASGLPVAASVKAMARLLERSFGFSTVTVLGDDATAEGIRAALRQLLDDTDRGDAVVVYYAGHGTLFRHAPRDGDGKVLVHLIQARDVGASELDDFRGLFGSELSLLVQALTGKTDNVTVILDCCHAADLIRPDDWELGSPASRDYQRELERAVARQVHRDPLDDPGNHPRAVVISASASGDKAYPDPEGGLLLFTDRLIAALTTDSSRTWQEVLRDVRRQVQAVRRAQLPGVAGARFRLPFTVDVGLPGPQYLLGLTDRDQVTVTTGKWRIEPGDRFELIAFGWGEDRRGVVVGEGTAIDVGSARSTLEVAPDPRRPPLPAVVYARRIETPRPRISVDPASARALASTPLAALLATWDTAAPASSGCVRLDPARGTIDVHDHDGDLVARVRLGDPSAAACVCEAVERVARWHALVRMLDDLSLPALEDCFDVDWGRLQPRPDGAPTEERLAEGACVAGRDGGPVFLRLINFGVLRRVYAHVYRVCAARSIRPWEDDDQAACVLAGTSRTFGPLSWRETRGLCLRWPHDELPTPETAAREWTLLVVSNDTFDRDLLPSDEPMPPVPTTRASAQRFAAILIPYELEHTLD